MDPLAKLLATIARAEAAIPTASIAGLRDLRTALIADANAVVGGAEKEARQLTDEEEAATGKAADLAESCKAAEKTAAAARIKQLAGASAGRRTITPDGPVVIGRPLVEDDPNAGYGADPKAATRAYLHDVLVAGMTGRVSDRLRPFASKADPDFMAAAGADEQGTYSDPYGGFLTPKGIAGDLKMLQSEGDPTAGLTQRIPLGAPSVNFPARVDKNHSTSVSGGLRVYRRAEADTSATSRMEFESVTLTAYGLFAVVHATEELLRDSPISIVALLQNGVGSEVGATIFEEKLNGTGVGQFLGVNNSACLVSVAKETGQAADTIVFQNIVKMRARCWGYDNAAWIANHDTLPQLMNLTQSAGTGGVPAWQPSARDGNPDTLLGRPIVFSERLATVGDAGDIILGNWSQYLEGSYEELQSAESMHVRFVNHERTFKFWLRNAGAPWWRSALTPKRGSTLSPFVRLDARA